jgi:aminoglycoside phosphotransferase (APT) family kinase protein
MLEQHEVAAYLMQRRLVGRRSVVDGRLRVADASSRNRNIRVSGAPGESYLLKQGLAADSAHTLANEAALYARLRDAPWTPALHAYDAARGLLVLEWIEGGADLLARRISPTLARALGRALADLHAIAPDDEDLRRDAPWVLALHRPPLEALRYLSAASVELVRLLQRDAPLTAALDDLRETWCCEALVHRDVKRANCVANGARVALVDWEMAGWGDPAWDVGSVLGERHDAAVERAFWEAYARARRLRHSDKARLLRRARRFAGARIVQSAFEHTQEVSALGDDVVRDIAAARALLLGEAA